VGALHARRGGKANLSSLSQRCSTPRLRFPSLVFQLSSSQAERSDYWTRQLNPHYQGVQWNLGYTSKTGLKNLDVELRDAKVKIIFRITPCKVFWTRLYQLDVQMRGTYNWETYNWDSNVLQLSAPDFLVSWLQDSGMERYPSPKLDPKFNFPTFKIAKF